MSGLEMHVIANGDLFREAFNAVVTVLGTSTFSTAFRLAVLFSIIGAAISYIKGRDLAVLGKWFMLYFAVTVILLGPKVDLHIIDSSDQGAVYDVAHVPYGLAFPASLITSIAYGLESSMEEAFSLPDDAEYSKTGLLFGSRVFGLSTQFHIVDPQVRADFNEYVKNCVIGDILINQKYSIKDLSNSTNAWSTISSNASPIRGILLKDGTFQTCREAASTLNREVSQDVTNNGLNFFGIRIFGEKGAGAAAKLKESLENAYSYYAKVSDSAENIMTQNVILNGIREGVLSYASEAGATASLVNLSSTQAMERTRMAWATSRNLATYVLPLMQTDILLMLLCMFPLIVLITVQPVFGVRIFKSYVYSLIWIESWPILFAVLNLAATFYLQHKTAGLADGGLTLSNSNSLALEHSDVGNMAGYLMTCVPFLAIGIVKGMDSAFSNAAQYIGGMLHSTASATATEAVTGNISLGNASYNNVNANKYDTNSTFMHGMSTSQLPNAALVTQTASGSNVYNTQGATSHLITNFHAGTMISSSLSHQAESARAAAVQDLQSYDHSTSDASSKLEHYAKSVGSMQNIGNNFASQEMASISHHASDMYSVVSDIAKRNGVTWNEAFKGLTTLTLGGGLSANVGLGIESKIKKPLGAEADVKLGGHGNLDWSRSNDTSSSHDIGSHLNISVDEAKRFGADWNEIKQYNATQHIDNSHSNNDTQLSQIAADFRNADTASSNYSSNITTSERLSTLASIAEQHSAQFDSNFNQVLADYVQQEAPDKAPYLLANTDNPRAIAELNIYANRLVHSPYFMEHIQNLYDKGSANINPSYLHQVGSEQIAPSKSNIENQYKYNAQHIDNQAKMNGVSFDERQYQTTKQDVQNGLQNTKSYVTTSGKNVIGSYNSSKGEIINDIKQGAEKADYSVLGKGTHHSIKPKFAVEEDKKIKKE